MPRGYTTARVIGCGAGAAERWAAVLDEHRRVGADGARRVGEVLQAYDRSAYIRLDRAALGGFEPLGPPLVLLGDSAFDGPLATRIATQGAAGFDPSDLEAGVACRLRAAADGGYGLTVGGALDVALDRSAVEPVRGPEHDSLSLGASPAGDRARAALEALTGFEDGLGWLDEVAGLASGKPPNGDLRDLIEGWAAVVADGAEPPVDVLGRGPGATPSGDDVTAGVLLGLDRTTVGERNERVRAAGRRVVRAAEERTTAVSAALLAQAAQGRAAGRVEAALVAVLGAREPTDIRGTVRAAADVGHTSGVDSLVGALLVPLEVAPRVAA